MKRFANTLLIAIASFYLGWQANGYFLPANVSSINLSSIKEWQQAAAPQPSEQTQAAGIDAVIPSPPAPPKNEDGTVSYSQKFNDLLAQQAFDEAMQLFDQVLATDETQSQSLKSDLMAYLQVALEQQQNENLMALIDAWLSRYYDDIDVLMILAEYQRRQGYPDEAARVFQLAFTYAFQPGERNKVSAAVQALVKRTDALFSRQQRWVELLGFYQLLDSVDLSQPDYQLSQAQVHLQLQDIANARALLLPLADTIQWGYKARELLAAIEQQTAVPDEVAAVASIPLLRQGGHYLVKVRLNEVSEVTLMIDTGASITSLSQHSFAALSAHSDFDSLGSRLFNTANGVTKGQVYRAEQFNLGETILRDVTLAVLDFQQGQGIDGLLGMNVLQHFRFEIDQDQQVLYLQAR